MTSSPNNSVQYSSHAVNRAVAKARSSRYWLIAKVVFVVSLGIVLLRTGGAAISNGHSFGGLRTLSLVDGCALSLWVDTQYSTAFAAPFLGGYSSTAPLPYALDVYAGDRDGRFETLTIDTVIVKYADGEEQAVDVAWSQSLRAGFHAAIPQLVYRNCSCTITLVGFLTTVEGVRRAFRVEDEFSYERQLGIMTFWDFVAGC